MFMYVTFSGWGINRPTLKPPFAELQILGTTLGVQGHSRSNSLNCTRNLSRAKCMLPNSQSNFWSNLVNSELVGIPKPKLQPPNSRSVLLKTEAVPARQNLGRRQKRENERKNKGGKWAKNGAQKQGKIGGKKVGGGVDFHRGPETT